MTPRDSKVRILTADQLGIARPPQPVVIPGTARTDDTILPDDDTTLTAVRLAMADGYAGAILSGVPGSGKSRHALLIARKLTEDDASRRAVVQFHPSYQYEDFVEGYVIDGDKFTRQPKTFAKICITASENPTQEYILVIDEFSRTDVARVFGEAFTYIERSKRNLRFTLASGFEMAVPANLFVLGTMNPWDRGADELDMALERRFAFVDMRPDREALRQILTTNGADAALMGPTMEFFDFLQGFRVEHCRLGHGYFVHVKDRVSLLRLWDFQLGHVLRRACAGDDGAFTAIQQRWDELIANPPAPAA